MDITYLGHACFRLRGREASIVTDPFGPGFGVNMGRPAASIVTVSHQHPHHAYVEGVAGEHRVISGPGEYEIANVLINGVQTAHNGRARSDASKPALNTAYVVAIDDLRICHLGDLTDKLTDEQIESLGSINVLMVPVGGGATIGPNVAAEVVSQLEPTVVIPMHYQLAKTKSWELEPVDRFVREMGVKEWEPVPKLSLAKASASGEIQVVVMEAKKG